jgi:CubicO group peptidase (beta-lactamase class C family)
VHPSLNRRTLLRATTATVAAAATLPTLGTPAVAAPRQPTTPATSGGLFDELDEKIQAGMATYGIPGVAVGVLYRGQEYVRGYGVTNVDHPTPVDPDTVFRIGSTTKTFTGTTVMRLVEQGRIDLDAPVRRYLPDFRYNNAALSVAGRMIEVVTGYTYEQVVRGLLIDPLGLTHSRYFTDEIIGFNVAASHDVVNGRPVVQPDFFRLWRSLNPSRRTILQRPRPTAVRPFPPWRRHRPRRRREAAVAAVPAGHAVQPRPGRDALRRAGRRRRQLDAATQRRGRADRAARRRLDRPTLGLPHGP